jgi:hypothetical protein
MPYAYVETKFPQWVTQLPSLRAVARREQKPLTAFFTQNTRARTQTSPWVARASVTVYWVPYLVEDVLTLLNYEERAYARATQQEKTINFALTYGALGAWSPRTASRPENAVLLTLPRADLEEQYIIPAIAASSVEGPEPEVLWPP